MERYFLSAYCSVLLAVAVINRADGSSAGTLNRFELSEGTCGLFREGETCFSDLETWYFESEGTDGCVNATEERCGGKGNRFQTKEECEDTCLGNSERNYETRNGYGYRRESYGYPYPGRQSRHDYCWGHCPNQCPGGFDRCQSCECNDYPRRNPICPPVRCPSHCETELLTGDNGCQRCDCRQRCQGYDCGDPCERVRCPTVCPRSYYPQLQQCCGCRWGGGYSRYGCGQFQCPNQCEYGHVDHPQYGCRGCECRSPPYLQYSSYGGQDSVRYSGYSYGSNCPQTLCELSCQNGYRRSSDGCDLCECAEYNYHPHLQDCSHLSCRRDCAFGCYVNQANCDTRVCIPSSTVLHRGQPYRQNGQYCPNIRSTCRQHCPYGYARDDSGCERCQCQDDAYLYEP